MFFVSIFEEKKLTNIIFHVQKLYSFCVAMLFQLLALYELICGEYLANQIAE